MDDALKRRDLVKAIAQRRELWEPGVGSVHMTADELLAFGEECAAGVTEVRVPPCQPSCEYEAMGYVPGDPEKEPRFQLGEET